MALPARWKSYAHQRETTGSSNDSLQLRPFSNSETSLKGKNPPPKSEFLPLWVVPYRLDNTFYHIKWPPLNITIFITHVRNLRYGCYANDDGGNDWTRAPTWPQWLVHKRLWWACSSSGVQKWFTRAFHSCLLINQGQITIHIVGLKGCGTYYKVSVLGPDV